MKFCKNLQRMITLFDPSWSPYWINYKMLKKLIKALPLLETEVDALLQGRQAFSAVFGDEQPLFHNGDNNSDYNRSGGSRGGGLGGEGRGDYTDDAQHHHRLHHHHHHRQHRHQEEHDQRQEQQQQSMDEELFATLAMSPREVAFFKLLHSELRKATYFFENVEKELMIREERIRHGIRIVQERQHTVSMITQKWLVVARSVHRLYRDLLTLETYAVMAYCSFSKILKKHDKVTGYPTRMAYMTSFVEKANFASYPRLLDMFHRCRRMDEEISSHMLQEVTNNLSEDERLFVRTVQQLSDSATQTTAERGTPPQFATHTRQEIWKPAVDAANTAATTTTFAIGRNTGIGGTPIGTTFPTTSDIHLGTKPRNMNDAAGTAVAAAASSVSPPATSSGIGFESRGGSMPLANAENTLTSHRQQASSSSSNVETKKSSSSGVGSVGMMSTTKNGGSTSTSKRRERTPSIERESFPAANINDGDRKMPARPTTKTSKSTQTGKKPRR